MRQRVLAVLVSIFTVALYFVVYQSSGYFITDRFGDRIPSTMALVIAAAITIPFILYPFFRTPRPSGEGPGSRREGVLWIFLTVIFGFALNILITSIPSLINDEAFQASNDAVKAGAIWQVLLCAGIVVPILEELVFRGVVFGQLRGAFGPVAGVNASAVLFGFFHLNLAQFIYGTAVGLMLGMCYERTKKLWFPILAHSLTNTVMVLLPYILALIQEK